MSARWAVGEIAARSSVAPSGAAAWPPWSADFSPADQGATPRLDQRAGSVERVAVALMAGLGAQGVVGRRVAHAVVDEGTR